MRNQFNKDIKSPKKYMKEVTMKLKDLSCSPTSRIKIVKMSILPKVSVQSQQKSL